MLCVTASRFAASRSIHRPLRLWRANAGAFHSAYSRRRARHFARRNRRQSRSGESLCPDDAAGKAGGHSERSIAIGTIEVAVWDAVAKIAGKPLHRVLAERFNGGKVPDKVFCYVGGGWYWPGQTIKDLQDEMRRHLDSGYTMVKMKVGGLPLADDVRRLGGCSRSRRLRRSSGGRR